MHRREFLASTAAGLGLPLWLRLSPWPRFEVGAPALRARAFPLSQVRLAPGPFLDAALVNQRFLLSQDPDRLLHTFRLTAGLPSSAEPLGGWEAPDNELRGHYTGHYLSACALLHAGLGTPDARTRTELMVSELAKCQRAIGNGYLSAFPEEFFDRLRAGQPVWAPWYTLHKIMAGLLDVHTLTGNAQALEVLKGMARWARGWVEPLSDAAMARVLEREYGGMNELFYNLSAVTGDSDYVWLAHRFDHERVFAPLAEGRDELQGLHANTTIPKIVGAARRYELTGETRSRRIAEYFWREVTTERSYCTGGTSNEENWNTPPGILSTELGGETQEDCCTYNMLKLTRHVFEWTADPACADYYERALFNGILGSQHPADGSKLYYVPLGAGYWKLFGTPFHDYWCCTGTMSEQFARLGDAIYFRDADGIYVNLFVASELHWPEKGIRLVQETRFPDEDTVRLTVRAARPVRMPLRIRVPYWVAGDAGARLNQRPIEGFAEPGGYFVVDRRWRDGDTLELRLPMRLHLHPMPDDDSIRAVMFGPLVLAGRLGTAGLTTESLRAPPTKPRTVPEFVLPPVPAPVFRVRSDDPATWIEPVPGRPLEFRTVGQAQNVTLVPFYRLFDERYAIYWKVTRG